MLDKLAGGLGGIDKVLKPGGGLPGLPGLGDILGGKDPIGQLLSTLQNGLGGLGLPGQPPLGLEALQKLLGGEEGAKKLGDKEKGQLGQALQGLNLTDQAKQLLGKLGIPGFVSKASGAGQSQKDSFGGVNPLDPLGIAKNLGLPEPGSLLGGAPKIPVGQFLAGVPGLSLRV